MHTDHIHIHLIHLFNPQSNIISIVIICSQFYTLRYFVFVYCVTVHIAQRV